LKIATATISAGLTIHINWVTRTEGADRSENQPGEEVEDDANSGSENDHSESQ